MTCPCDACWSAIKCAVVAGAVFLASCDDVRAADQVFRSGSWSLVCGSADPRPKSDPDSSECILGQTVAPANLNGVEFTFTLFVQNWSSDSSNEVPDKTSDRTDSRLPYTRVTLSDTARGRNYGIRIFAPLGVPLWEGVHLSSDTESLGDVPPEYCDEEGCKFKASLSRSQLELLASGNVASLRLAHTSTNYYKIDFELQGVADLLDLWANPELRAWSENRLATLKNEQKYMALSYISRNHCSDMTVHKVIAYDRIKKLDNDKLVTEMEAAVREVIRDVARCKTSKNKTAIGPPPFVRIRYPERDGADSDKLSQAAGVAERSLRRGLNEPSDVLVVY